MLHDRVRAVVERFETRSRRTTVRRSLALIVGVTVGLGRASLIDPLTIASGVLALVIQLRFKINSTWLVLGGALLGLLAFSLR